MISLKSYLFRETGEEAESAYRRMIGLFLQGIALHAVEGDRVDYERFRADLEKSERSLTPEVPISEVFLIVGGALRALEDYNRRTGRFVRRQSMELQNIVSMLTETVISIGAHSEHSVSRLQDIEKSLERASELEDIQILKHRLGECLEAVREEAKRQKIEGQKTIDVLQEQLDTSRECSNSLHLRDIDPATGLPGRQEAQRALEGAVATPAGKYLLIAVVNRVQAVNARFGYSIGDRILGAFAERFVKGLSARDQAFRWQGPSIIAVLERAERIERVRAEIRQFADTKLDKTVEVGSRTVLIPISASWSLFPVAPPLAGLLKKLETFTAAQAPRDYA